MLITISHIIEFTYMKKTFPIRAYFIRARVFGFIVLFIMLFCLVYFILGFINN